MLMNACLAAFEAMLLPEAKVKIYCIGEIFSAKDVLKKKGV